MAGLRIGQPAPREEDARLLKGAGRYVDDLALLGQAYAYVLRSPHAHAAIRAVDADQARSAAGVLLVLTGEDAPVRDLGPQVPRIPRKRRDGSPAFHSPQPHLARARVRYVGDPVAMIVAETFAQAKEAAELIEVDYDILSAVIDIEQAVQPGATPVWDACPDNQAYFHEAGNKAAVNAAFAAADRVVRNRLVINRITANSMEPRGCLALYDAHDDRYILHCTVQSPHRVRNILATQIFRLPETKFRVIADNVGGGFGMKGACYPEYVVSLVAARLLGRPVKWICERGEGLLCDDHARDNVTDAELAVAKNGRFLAFRVRTLAACGAYFNSDRNAGPATQNLGVLAGTYTTPAVHAEVAGVLTHTMLTGFYRGAGRPEAAYVIEATVDKAARELGIDPAELRRRNMIPADAMPFRTGLLYTYDSGNFLKNFEDCLREADYRGFSARREQARKRERLRGIGVSSTVEASNSGMIEAAEVRFDPSGTLTLLVGTHDHGQGHETTFKQVLCERLGIDSSRVRFKCGDTDEVMSGSGTFGSRSAVMGGSAVRAAAEKIVAKARKIASHLLEAAEQDLVFDAGKFTVAGTDKSLDIVEVAKCAFTPNRLPP